MANIKKDEIRSEVYDWALNLYKKGYKYPSIILLLSTWNFAYFRYILKDFNFKNFKKDFKKLNNDFRIFENKGFKDIDLNDKEIEARIKRIYTTLSEAGSVHGIKRSGIKPVGATKVMHLVNPNFFVMWDNGIISHYKKDTKKNRKSIGKIDNSANGYFNFMRLMQKLYKEGKFKSQKFSRDKSKNGIPRAIDLYNLRWQSGKNNG